MEIPPPNLPPFHLAITLASGLLLPERSGFPAEFTASSPGLSHRQLGLEKESCLLGFVSPPTHRNSLWFYASLGNVAI